MVQDIQSYYIVVISFHLIMKKKWIGIMLEAIIGCKLIQMD
jgi:hypothetical protein